MSQDFGDLALLGRELSDHLVRQQLRPFPECSERRFELVRHMAEESIFLLFEVREPQAHPVESFTEVLKIFRATDANRSAEIGLTEASYRGIDLADRTCNENRKTDDEEDDD